MDFSTDFTAEGFEGYFISSDAFFSAFDGFCKVSYSKETGCDNLMTFSNATWTT